MTDRINYTVAEASVLLKAGWWKNVVNHAIRQVLKERLRGIDQAALASAAGKLLGTDDLASLHRAINELVKSGDVIRQDNQLHLGESVRQRLVEAETRHQQLSSRIEQHYERLRVRLSDAADCPTWPEFSVNILTPLISELGAQTVELMNGRPAAGSQPVLERYIQAHATEGTRRALREMGTRFFDPDSSDVRTYIYSNLQAYYFTAAQSLDKAALRQLTDTRRPAFKLLIDTNALFSILELHHNPANEATRYLLDLRSRVSEYADVEFFALSETIVEARAALDAAREACGSAVRTSAQAQAMSEEAHASGLIDRYQEIARDSPITAATYFEEKSRYIELSCEALGIKLIEENQSSLTDSADFRARVNDWLTWQEGRRHPRSRGSVRHDILCLSYVRAARRPPTVSVVADATWWFLTVDLRLKRFEKANIAGNRLLPCSISPGELTQVLQFWSARPEELDQALVVSLRLPFAFYDYDNDEAQKTSLEILSELNKFEGADEMSAEATRRILIDSGLRSVFEDDNASPELRHAAIESAAIRDLAEVEKLRTHLAEELAQLQNRQSQGEASATRNTKLQGGQEESKRKLLERAKSAAKEADGLKKLIDRQRDDHQTEIEKLRDQIASLETQVGALEIQADRRRLSVSKALALLFAVLTASAIMVLTYLIRPGGAGQSYKYIVAGAVALAVGLLILPVSAKILKIDPSWRVSAFCKRGWAWLAASLVGGVIGTAIQFAIAPPVASLPDPQPAVSASPK